jgi:predicted Zn-dependent protease
MQLASGVALALALVGCGRAAGERAREDMAILRAEHSSEKLVARGRGFASVGDLTRAEEYLTAALDQGADPRVVMPLLLDVCVRDGRYRSAIQHAEAHLQRQPNDLPTRLVLGTLYAALGEAKAARLALEQVVSDQPDEAQAHYVLAVVARDQEADVVAADRHFREYLRIQPEGSHADEARGSLLKRLP